MSIDVIKFFDDFQIPHHSHGKRCTKGWEQTYCPFPDCDDSEDYMGVHRQSGVFHCWLCGRKGPFAVLASKLLKIRFSKIEDILLQYEDDALNVEERQEKHSEKVEVKGFLNYLPEQHRQYLIERNFDPNELIRRYKIGAFGTYGRFPYRIAIPVFDDGELVNMTARDITAQQEARYLTLTNEESVIPIKSCVYNIDSCIKDSILIVEGPFDAWRIGGATVSFFGTAFKTSQVLKVLSKTPKNVFVLFDENAGNHAEKLAHNFSPFVKHVEVLEISVKDPALLSPEEALNIHNELNL
jgi:DNA primase